MSLEKNVIYFQRMLQKLESGASSDIFFGDGLSHGNVVQYQDTHSPLPRANELLSELTGWNGDGVETRYRPHEIHGVAGPATRRELNAWFDKTGSKLHEGDRLFIYFTGHGGAGNPSRNTNFTLWGEPAMSVKDFTGLLEKVSPKVQVVLVMVQCHAGGFADVIFKGANANAGLSDARRCGFFATWPERPAAGCTPDISEEDYKEYSTYFLAALYGKDRLDHPVTRPDFDGDGKTSLAEAHAYVQLNSDTIDIPLATSDVFLRRYSRTKEANKPGTKPSGATTVPARKLLTADSDLPELMKHASPGQKAVLAGLMTRLKLSGSDLAKDARQAADRFERERRALNNARGMQNGERNRLRNELRWRLLLRWPQLQNPWNPRAAETLESEGEKVVKSIESDPAFARYEKVSKEVNEKEAKALDLERQWAKCQRILYILESVALRANLEQVAGKEMVERYKAIVKEEEETVP